MRYYHLILNILNRTIGVYLFFGILEWFRRHLTRGTTVQGSRSNPTDLMPRELWIIPEVEDHAHQEGLCLLGFQLGSRNPRYNLHLNTSPAPITQCATRLFILEVDFRREHIYGLSQKQYFLWIEKVISSKFHHGFC